MDFDSVNRVAFHCEWFKEEAMVIKSFLLIYYPTEKAGELFDSKSQKRFLRKTSLDLCREDFYIGSKLDIFGRQIEIVDFADEFTRKLLGKSRQRIFLLVKTPLINKASNILKAFEKSGFCFANALMVRLNEQYATYLFGDRARGNQEITNLISEIVSGPVIGIEMFADHAFQKLEDSSFSNVEAPRRNKNIVSAELEFLFSEEIYKKGIYFSKSQEDANDELKKFFCNEINQFNTALLNNTVLGIIKPHIFKEGKVGECLHEIINCGYKITAFKICVIDRSNCEEFFEVYRGVCHEYMQMISELASGPCLALEIQKPNSQDIHKEFREFCGPKNPDIAKQLRPNTLRAKFGKNKVLNAIHVTDLPDDVILELQYIFKIL
ncbi:nucleoside diphosphate kinase 7 [Condylostylus longicornis]|uniref:nucleoside diphosphate kinase 7 n=1 Tax=Condylostylus longicornis TaxID=2530218 RepID=UPI00244E1747|nr:nucleoside diphosphate kinase 7 [Condylostylus longicornis]